MGWGCGEGVLRRAAVQWSVKFLQDPDVGFSVLQQAFWCLVTICEKYLPGYYSAGLVSPARRLQPRPPPPFIGP